MSETMRRLALAATLLVPLGLLHAFILAEIGVGLTCVLFLAHSLWQRDFAWLRPTWVRLALIWWVWLLFCSTPLPWPGFGVAGWVMGFGQALAVLRFIIFTAALQSWVLTTPASRRWAWAMLAASTLWIGIECWQQYLTGKNIFGDPRWRDGALTGPFWKPRAGALYTHLLYPAMLAPALALLGRPGWQRAAGWGLLLAGVVTSVLIGQRMGVALAGLGLGLAAVCFRPLRLPALLAALLAALFLIATPILSPPTYAKLVGETSHNMGHFWQSPYGELYTRATVMGLQSPWHGWGYNGFRASCPAPRFGSGLPVLHIPPTQLVLGACNLHPHNYYIQALTDAGFPGLILFIALALAWLRGIAASLWRQPEPLQVGIFIGIVTYLWPIGSTDEFPAMYMLGWMFFMLGLGLAAQHPADND